MNSRFGNRYTLYVMAGASVLVSLLSVRFLFLELGQAAPGLAVHEGVRDFAFYCHVGGASVALLVGPWQFFKKFRARFPIIHRCTGTVYLCACLVGGVSGIYIGYYSPNGPIAAAGFMLLGVLWIAATCLGVANILNGNPSNHRRWMIRSFAMTFAAVTLRLFIPPLFVFGVDEVTIFSLLAWISWIPNLFIAERYLITR